MRSNFPLRLKYAKDLGFDYFLGSRVDVIYTFIKSTIYVQNKEPHATADDLICAITWRK